jgi:Zn-dependent M32 family carboxypeptidase
VTEKFQELKTRLAAIHDLRMARAILGWDQHTKMPPKAGPVRAEQLGTLDRFTHELFIDDEIGRLLEDVRGYEESLDPDSDDACLIRVTRRDYEKASRVSPDLRAELTRSGAIALALRLLDLPPVPQEERRAPAPVHRLLRRHGLRERLRRPARRLRRGAQDRCGP